MYKKKGNPTLACHSALTTRCNIIFAYSHKDQGLSCSMTCFCVILSKKERI